uniref:Ig-like domain-containing protein n=1 Tax=Ascaris lumbricoides TaxID=6252 RepID=A0A0M3IFT2_ASCLU
MDIVFNVHLHDSTLADLSICPPKLEMQSADEVWFQSTITNNFNNKFSLRCQASENPETFEWYKDGRKLEVDGERILWQKPSQSGNILFVDPQPHDEGYYQCFISNIFGTAVSSKVHVQRGGKRHFEWYKDGRKLEVDGERILWQKPSQSGNILFVDPQPHDEGYYQCFISNIFGTAVSSKVHVQRGGKRQKVNHVCLVLEHFKERPIRRMIVEEGRSLSVECNVPHGIPSPSVFWLYRDTVQTSIIETIRRPHIAVDPQGILSYYPHFVLERYAIFHIIHKRSKYINTGRNGQNCRDYR